MKQNRHYKIAQQFSVLENCERLEASILSIEGTTSVDFDLDGFLDNMNQVIFLVGYDVPVSAEDYFKRRAAIRLAIAEAALKHDLVFSGDPIEDYGEHFYFVMNCGKSWMAAQ